jgi:hypothetical protein
MEVLLSKRNVYDTIRLYEYRSYWVEGGTHDLRITIIIPDGPIRFRVSESLEETEYALLLSNVENGMFGKQLYPRLRSRG